MEWIDAFLVVVLVAAVAGLALVGIKYWNKYTDKDL